MLEYLMLFGFGVLESVIVIMFCKIIGRIDEIKIAHIMMLSVIVTACLNFTTPFLKQIIIFVVVVGYMKIISKRSIIKLSKLFIMSMMFLLVFEVIGSIIYDLLFDMNFANSSLNDRLLLLVPVRVVQIFTLYIIWGNRHWGLSGLEILKK